MSHRTSRVDPGQGESLQSLLAYTVQNGSPAIGLRVAHWITANPIPYERYATARTALKLELTTTRGDDDFDHQRVLGVLRAIDEQGAARYFGADVVRTLGGPEISMLDVGARDARAIAAAVANLGRAIDRANEAAQGDRDARLEAVDTVRTLQDQVASLRQQLAEKGLELDARPPSFRDAWVVANADGRLWDGRAWTAELGRAERFTQVQVDDIVSLQRTLEQQGLPFTDSPFLVRNYDTEHALWKDLEAPAAERATVQPVQPSRVALGMSALVTPPALGITR